MSLFDLFRRLGFTPEQARALADADHTVLAWVPVGTVPAQAVAS